MLTKIESCDITVNRRGIELSMEFIIYKYNNQDLIVLKKGALQNKERVPLRIHSGCVTGDLFGSSRCDCGNQLDYMYQKIQDIGYGLIIYIADHEGRGIGLVNKIKAYKLMQDKNIDTFESHKQLGFEDDYRSFDFVKDILIDLEIINVILYTNNPDKIKACEGFIANNENIITGISSSNYNYLCTKHEKKNHNLKLKNYDDLKKNNITISLIDFKVGIIYTKWNHNYVLSLVNGCSDKLQESGFQKDNIHYQVVPGSYDLLYGIMLMMKKKLNLDAILVIGILLKGETSHYDFLMNSIGDNLPKLQMHYDIPIINGILTCENEEQIINRVITNNHGIFWANAIIDLISSNSSKVN